MPSKYTDDSLEEFHRRIGLNVKLAREQKGITQLELSNMLGYKSVSVVSKAELCIERKYFGIDHLYQIAKVLDIDICDLIRTD
ncbi:XRE family transcriptional regulator [Sulfuricurvum sp. IAE1]|uniref:helix-turn-helix domain-containing protein n=1 Tax=Sulfuricurvum sp. IAE1 TaxID=2546102 RepID=UPI00104B5F05|nr:helix-turn-helix transcriptional regulator [Sulfuricurvum sp. IAE1]TDA62371.1 XRE family transcriptional regulator [Sulfuricurvum sp. IAE1]